MLLIFPLFFCSQVLLISFLVVLWRSGRYATTNLLAGQHQLWVVIKYSTTISLVMGSIFSCISIVYWSALNFLFLIGGILMFAKLFLPIVIIFAATFAVFFLIGLLVCYVIKRQVIGSATFPTDSEIHRIH